MGVFLWVRYCYMVWFNHLSIHQSKLPEATELTKALPRFLAEREEKRREGGRGERRGEC